MGNKKRGKIPPIKKDYMGYHITHTHNDKGNHMGKVSIYAGKNLKKNDFDSVVDAIKYIDSLINNADKK
jgi:hypothetical protein